MSLKILYPSRYFRIWAGPHSESLQQIDKATDRGLAHQENHQNMEQTVGQVFISHHGAATYNQGNFFSFTHGLLIPFFSLTWYFKEQLSIYYTFNISDKLYKWLYIVIGLPLCPGHYFDYFVHF